VNEQALTMQSKPTVVYDSDSEDEYGYEYRGDRPLCFRGKKNCKALIFFRGIHFLPSIFSKKERSNARKIFEMGMPIFSLASYKRSQSKCTDRYTKGESQDLVSISLKMRDRIINFKNRRDKFQHLYINSYNKFIEQFKCNPIVSTSEIFRPCGKYAYGTKFSANGIKKLRPEYDKNGKPKHPYLGKVYVMLVADGDVEKLGGYFVVHAHKNKRIKVSCHFSNNILSEREVSFPGFIPGNCVVFEKPVRLPSFSGEYKKYYAQKYGITKRSFKIIQGKLQKDLDKTDPEAPRKKLATVDNLITKVIEHTAEMLKNHIEKECREKNIEIVYKSFDNGFSPELPKL
jgi:hypothetical protein